MMRDFHAAAIVFDIDLLATIAAMIESENTKLLTGEQIGEHHDYYQAQGLEVNFIGRLNGTLLYFEKKTGHPLPSIHYTQPDWHDPDC
ncbi:MAG: hypothetical protein OIF55_07380 [Amphritea sp.]|nr:hypothetical protein [Amphritea sp.]